MTTPSLLNQETNNDRDNQEMITLNNIDLALSSGFDINKAPSINDNADTAIKYEKSFATESDPFINLDAIVNIATIPNMNPPNNTANAIGPSGPINFINSPPTIKIIADTLIKSVTSSAILSVFLTALPINQNIPVIANKNVLNINVNANKSSNLINLVINEPTINIKLDNATK